MLPLQARIVPLIVEYDAFWTRYFYRLHRLEQKHAQFQQLTQRTLAAQAEEEEVRLAAALCSAAAGVWPVLRRVVCWCRCTTSPDNDCRTPLFYNAPCARAALAGWLGFRRR